VYVSFGHPPLLARGALLLMALRRWTNETLERLALPLMIAATRRAIRRVTDPAYFSQAPVNRRPLGREAFVRGPLGTLQRIAPASVWLTLAVIVVGRACPAHALPAYLTAFETQYPAAKGSRIDACNLCHSNVPQLNPYGSAFLNAGFMFGPIEASDSDGDGASNLAEIMALTFPGDPHDVPALPSPTPTATLPLATVTATSTHTIPIVTATTTVTPAVTATRTGGGPACVGDCNGNGMVFIDELVTAVNIALGAADVSDCLAVDRNGNGKVSIDELVLAVNAALNGC